MHDGMAALTEREKETLRLLLAGHDAKSIARHLGLSVHTINERLRDARRKLAVSSSRAAARLLADAERDTPEKLTDKRLGVAPATIADGSAAPDRRTPGQALVWFGGGMLMMSLIVVALLLPSGSGPLGTPAAAPARVRAAAAVDPGAVDAARRFVRAVDARRWDESWGAVGTLARAQVTEPQWTTAVRAARDPLGTVSAQTMQAARTETTLPGAPDGRYALVEWRTAFASRRDAVETVVLAQEGATWRVAGYFIR